MTTLDLLAVPTGYRQHVGEIVAGLVLTGLGQGLFQSPNTRAFMNAAPGNARGEASGLMTTGRVVGQSLSVAVAGAIFTGLGGAAAGRALAAAASTVPLAPSAIVALQDTFLAGFGAALTVAAGLAAVGILAALVRGDEGRSIMPPSRSTRHRGRVRSFDTCNFFHSSQEGREVLFMIVLPAHPN